MSISLSLLLAFTLISGSLNMLPAQRTAGFTNPILAGFYPDPSICRVESDYYLVTSTFSYFPGIPVFHSRDLVHWNQIGSVLNRPGQLDLDSLGVSRGIFAPAIRYSRGLFYVTCTVVDKGGNFVVTSKDPAGPWSDPVWIPQINGIDPSLFFDDDGKAYIVYNSIPPEDRPLYSGHRTIRMYSFDTDRLEVSGDERILVNGGTDITKNPAWIEGPHLFHKDSLYYLIAAEGGTGDNHSEVVFKSTGIEGPFVPYDKNPILTQRDLDPRREFPVTCTGHADFVQTEAGEWWAVFLGCRPYRPFEEGHFNTGRETFLAPVRWRDGWPRINPDHKEIQYFSPLPATTHRDSSTIPLSGNFSLRDDFNELRLRPDWMFLRTPREKWYSLSERKGFLALRVRPETCADPVNPSFVARRQQHASCTATASLDFVPQSENEKAGVVVFQNEKRFYFLCQSLEGRTSVVQLYRSIDSSQGDHQMELIASRELKYATSRETLKLQVVARGSSYKFCYSFSPGPWSVLKDSVDAGYLSTRSAGGFVGCTYALYATSLGKPSRSVAYVDWFTYTGNDEVYK